jgi:hypothetical protein
MTVAPRNRPVLASGKAAPGLREGDRAHKPAGQAIAAADDFPARGKSRAFHREAKSPALAIEALAVRALPVRPTRGLSVAAKAARARPARRRRPRR